MHQVCTRIKTFPWNCYFKCGIHKPSILMNPKCMQSIPLSYVLFASILRTMNHCIYCYRIECRWFTGIVDFNQLTKRTFIRPSYLFWAFQFSSLSLLLSPFSWLSVSSIHLTARRFSKDDLLLLTHNAISIRSTNHWN